MTDLIDPLSALYAVIEARWSDGPERFVIAYRDEESLRHVIAAPSIVGVGFITREEALASADCWLPVARGSKQSLRASADKAEKHQCGLRSAKRRLGDGFRVAETRRIVCRALQHAAAMAIMVFYSRNIASAAIRTVIGAS
jgi:hypothetical protein